MPKRLIVFFHGHGTIVDQLIPGADFSMAPILQSVADAGLTSKLLVLGGIDNKVGNGHDHGPVTLTCTPIQEGANNQTYATSESVEHSIARHMRDGGAPRRLDVGVEWGTSVDPSSTGLSDGHTRVFWSGLNERISTQMRPDLAFDAAFPDVNVGGGSTTVTDTELDLQAIQRKSVLDSVLTRFNALRGRVSASDRERLDLHASKIREIESSLQTTREEQREVVLPALCGEAPSIDLSDLDHRRAAEAQIDILAHAMACNHADVGTFKIMDMPREAFNFISNPSAASDIDATFAGTNYHNAWHKASDGKVDPETEATARRAFTAIIGWYGDLFARLMTRLDAIDEGDGTALDNTMVLWISDFGPAGGHNCSNLHTVMAGNAGGASLGRYVNLGAGDPSENYGSRDGDAGVHNLA
ncbi:MAG: DUF1552 domain-containing protein, partial [Myxococcota bacterium]